MSESNKFWVVWCEGFGPPSVKHPTLRDAVKEAKRLASVNAGATFTVLESCGAARKTDVEWTNHIEPEPQMPF